MSTVTPSPAIVVLVTGLFNKISPPSSPAWANTLNFVPSYVKVDSATKAPDPSDVNN